MNFRLTLILAIILLAVGAVVYYAQLNPPAPKTATEPEHLLLGKAPKSVDTMALARDNKTLAAFQKSGENWTLTEPLKAPVEKWQVDSIADSLRNLSYRDKFSPEPTGAKSLEGTGVEPARAVVTFTDDAKVVHTLAVGKRTPVGTRYVRLDKDPAIYEVDGSWFEKLDKDPSDFRSKDLLQITSDRITGITLERSDQTIQINKTDGKWTIVKPITTRANSTTADDMASAVNSLRVESFSDTPRESAGLTPPVLTVTVQAKEKSETPAVTQPATQPKITPTTLAFGNYADLTKKTVYASVSGSGEVYVISADVFKKFNKPLFDVRDAAITPAAVDDATTLEITSTVPSSDPTVPAKVSLTKKDYAWSLQSPAVPADSSAVSTILGAIKNLRANKFVDSPGDLKAMGLEPAQKTITLSLPGQTQRETILIGRAQAGDLLTPVQRQGEPTVFLVQAADLAKLSPSLLALRDKSVAKLAADSIRSIAISGPGVTGPVKLDHAGANWTVNGKAADSVKVTSLLADFDPLTAQRWIAMAPHAGAAPDVQIDVLTSEAASTQPATLPAPQAAGPQPKHEVHHTLLLYRVKDATPATAPAATQPAQTWAATLSPGTEATAWTFEPASGFMEHVTKTSYEAPTTTAPATAPAP